MYKFPLPLILSIAAIQPLLGNETLTLKRITEFWKDEAFDQAKGQILQFLADYPASDYRDNVNAMLGDLYLKEGAYSDAIKTYDQIVNKEMQTKIEANYLQALFEMEDFRAILKKANKQSNDPKVHFLAGEACFRLGRQAPDAETQKALYIQASAHFNMTTMSSYGEYSLAPLAEVYKALGESEKAATLYMQLAEKTPDQKENFLFQAAYLQADFDKKLAAKTFEKVHALSGKNSKNAAYNVLMLQYEAGNYKDFLASYSKMENDLPAAKLESLQLQRGEAHFELGDIAETVKVLENCKGKAAYLLLAACAEKTEDLKLLDKVAKEMSAAFPTDPDTAKAHLLSAHLSMNQGDMLRAQDNLAFVLKNFPEYDEREKLMFDYAQLLARNTLWEESKAAFENLLTSFPNTVYKDETWRHLLNCALKEGKRDVFTSVLSRALNESNAFTGNEKEHYSLLLVKLLIEQGNRGDAASRLVNFLEAYPSSAEGYQVAALFYENDASTFSLYAEKALALGPDLQENDVLHLKLYNHYIENVATHDKAAEHLYTCVSKNAVTLQNDNLVWLANFYFGQKSDGEKRKRAIMLYEKIANSEITPALEKEYLKYAELLDLDGKSLARVDLLEKLSAKQQETPNLAWRFQRQTLFDLAKAYQESNDSAKALKAYDTLIETSTHMPSFFSRAATLERARLKYQLMTEEERVEGSSEMEEVLTALKDLQMRKKLHSEPIHLEAALDYVAMMSSLSAKDKQDERSLFLMKRVKQEFSSQGDVASKDYHSQRSVLPEKAKILEDYLAYMDAEILRMEGKMERAEKLYAKLNQGNLDSSLQKRVTQRMEPLYDARSN